MDCANRFTPVTSVIEWFKDEQTGFLWTSTAQLTRGVPSRVTFDYADRWCHGAGGRLPSVDELLGLIDRSVCFPATFMPETVSGIYWSSTASVSNSNSVWVVDFSEGLVVRRSTISGEYCFAMAVNNNNGEIK